MLPLLSSIFYYNFKFLSLKELAITETDEKLIATAAITGESNKANTGYNTPTYKIWT